MQVDTVVHVLVSMVVRVVVVVSVGGEWGVLCSRRGVRPSPQRLWR